MLTSITHVADLAQVTHLYRVALNQFAGNSDLCLLYVIGEDDVAYALGIQRRKDDQVAIGVFEVALRNQGNDLRVTRRKIIERIAQERVAPLMSAVSSGVESVRLLGSPPEHSEVPRGGAVGGITTGHDIGVSMWDDAGSIPHDVFTKATCVVVRVFGQDTATATPKSSGATTKPQVGDSGFANWIPASTCSNVGAFEQFRDAVSRSIGDRQPEVN